MTGHRPPELAAADKTAVRDFWAVVSCGELYARGDTLQDQLTNQARVRYELEPFIHAFARFAEGTDRRVLEIGVGMGADHLEWARSQPDLLTGIDLTSRAVSHTRARLDLCGEQSSLQVGDAEDLPFASDSFDIVYCWGVLHHSPDTRRAVAEMHRVLRPGGRASVMIYHRNSVVGALLWLRYGCLRGLSMSEVYARYLESPGTKAYSISAGAALFAEYSSVETKTELSSGDLMLALAGQRHDGVLLRLARIIWPRSLIRRLMSRHGLFMLITAIK